jgi:hypothetical protein
VEGIILDVSRHLNESDVAVGTMGSGAGPAGSHSTTGKTLNLLRFATFCLCSLSAWTLGRRALVTCQAAKKLVHILSYSDDSLVLEFAALALSNCATEAEGSAVVVLGAPTLCKMLKSRRYREALNTGTYTFVARSSPCTSGHMTRHRHFVSFIVDMRGLTLWLPTDLSHSLAVQTCDEMPSLRSATSRLVASMLESLLPSLLLCRPSILCAEVKIY